MRSKEMYLRPCQTSMRELVLQKWFSEVNYFANELHRRCFTNKLHLRCLAGA